jgi:hypothetical protein
MRLNEARVSGWVTGGILPKVMVPNVASRAPPPAFGALAPINGGIQMQMKTRMKWLQGTTRLAGDGLLGAVDTVEGMHLAIVESVARFV